MLPYEWSSKYGRDYLKEQIKNNLNEMYGYSCTSDIIKVEQLILITEALLDKL